MTGAHEEAGKAVGLFVEVMRSQPLSLALVVMNIALLFVLWWILSAATEFRKSELDIIFKANKEIHDLLSRCVVPPRANAIRSPVFKPE